jgi:hypothetical protein
VQVMQAFRSLKSYLSYTASSTISSHQVHSLKHVEPYSSSILRLEDDVDMRVVKNSLQHG